MACEDAPCCGCCDVGYTPPNVYENPEDYEDYAYDGPFDNDPDEDDFEDESDDYCPPPDYDDYWDFGDPE